MWFLLKFLWLTSLAARVTFFLWTFPLACDPMADSPMLPMSKVLWQILQLALWRFPGTQHNQALYLAIPSQSLLNLHFPGIMFTYFTLCKHIRSTSSLTVFSAKTNQYNMSDIRLIWGIPRENPQTCAGSQNITTCWQKLTCAMPISWYFPLFSVPGACQYGCAHTDRFLLYAYARQHSEHGALPVAKIKHFSRTSTTKTGFSRF